MKIILSIIVVLIVGALVFIGVKNSDGNDVDQETATTTESMPVVLNDGEYQVNVSESNLIWTGSKELIANYKDVGTLKVKEGNFSVASSSITGGEVVFDMGSLVGTETSNTEVTIDKLATHLKSADFFDVAKYPTSKIVIKSVVQNGADYIVTGDLTIKDSTNEISFPAKISINESSDIVLDGDVTFDRTKWNLKYGSGTFIDDLGDNVISDSVTVNVRIVASAQQI